MVELGILQDIDQCEPIEFDEFIGDFNYIQSLQDSIDPLSYQPEPTLAQARNFAIEFGALPLGSAALRQSTPVVRSILLYGPKGSGKSFLSHAIAHTTVQWCKHIISVSILYVSFISNNLQIFVAFVFTFAYTFVYTLHLH